LIAPRLVLHPHLGLIAALEPIEPPAPPPPQLGLELERRRHAALQALGHALAEWIGHGGRDVDVPAVLVRRREAHFDGARRRRSEHARAGAEREHGRAGKLPYTGERREHESLEGALQSRADDEV